MKFDIDTRGISHNPKGRRGLTSKEKKEIQKKVRKKGILTILNQLHYIKNQTPFLI